MMRIPRRFLPATVLALTALLGLSECSSSPANNLNDCDAQNPCSSGFYCLNAGALEADACEPIVCPLTGSQYVCLSSPVTSGMSGDTSRPPCNCESPLECIGYACVEPDAGPGADGGPADAMESGTPCVAATVTSVSVNGGKTGTPVTISGTNLGGMNAQVLFNGIAAQLTSGTDTSLVVTVPYASATGVVASTGALTVTTACGIVTALPVFTIPVGTAYTQYNVIETQTIVKAGTCLSLATAQGLAATDVTFGSDGTFWNAGPPQPGAAPFGTSTPSGGFSVVNFSLGAGEVTQSYSGQIGPDGAVSGAAATLTVPQGSSIFASNCWGDTETYTIAWTPQGTSWNVQVLLTFPKRCPMNNGTVTGTPASVAKSPTMGNLLTISAGGYGTYTGLLTTGGAYVGTGMNGTLVGAGTLTATFKADGSATGTVGFLYPDGCTETNPFTMTPFSPVLLGLP